MENKALKTQVSKGQVKSRLDFEGDQRVTITTSKSGRGVTTFASYSKFESRGAFVTETHTIFQDYAETIAVHSEIKRATEKALLAAHEKTVQEKLSYVLDRLAAQYGELKIKSDAK